MQKRNPAVVQKRVAEGKIDFYPTPLWATRCLLDKFTDLGISFNRSVLEPAAGCGAMERVLKEGFSEVVAYDLYDPAERGYEKKDYLLQNETGKYDWIITNPPFSLADKFCMKALMEAKMGVAIFGRIAFLEGNARYQRVFSKEPPTHVFVFTERVNIQKGKLDFNASSAVCYGWYVWAFGFANRSTRLGWFGSGTRAKFERQGDYE